MMTVGTLRNIGRQPRGDQMRDGGARRHQNLAAHVSALFFARELIFEMHAGRAGFDHCFDQFENIQRAAKPGFRISDDRSEPIDLVLAFGVMRSDPRAATPD